MFNVAEWKRRIASIAVIALALGLAPWAAPIAEAACSPRLFSELGPAPNSVSQPSMPSSDPLPFQAADPEDETPPDETPFDPPAIEPDPPPTDEAPPAAPEQPPAVVTPPPPRCSFYYDMDHPIAGPSATLSVFGAVRDAGDRWHAGVDISARKLTPVVAVHEGVISEVNRNGEGDCCWVKVRHTDGWSSLYVHLNNDLYGTDDGTGTGIVRGLAVGDEVARGQVIGYVGDSGNAEPGVPHLHFELRTRWGESVDPLPSIRRAERRGVSAFGELENPPYGFDGPFADAPEDSIGLIALGTSIGMPLACDDYGLFFCGSDPVDDTTVATWVDALVTDRLNPSTWGTAIADLTGPTDAELERLMRLCGDDCEQTLTHDDLVAFLHRVEGVPTELLDVLYQDELLMGCDLPDEKPPVSRLQALRTLMRAFGYLEPPAPQSTPPCSQID
jgi:murein DD-endopeptidase MepM/ murein hydrolase activator NlpD